MKTLDKLRDTSRFLKNCGIAAAEKEAEVLIRHSLDINNVEIYRDNPELSGDQIRTVEGMLKRRHQREPFQYIVGYEEFTGLKLAVGPGVLIPRPETEFMAEQAIKRFAAHGSRFTVLDLCTGSGCLALSIAKEFPDAKVYGSEISETAINYARENAKINGIENAVFLKGSFFQPVEEMSDVYSVPVAFDFIISNPPYIRTDEIKNLQPEIKDWEPVVALDGGADGLDFYRELIPAASRFLKDKSLIMFELGYSQADSVAQIIESSGYAEIEIIRDYAGIERIIKAEWKK